MGRALYISGIEVQCVSVSEHVLVGGSGFRGGVGLPAGGIRASQGTFSSFILWYTSNIQTTNGSATTF